jgi:hypothetical protein
MDRHNGLQTVFHPVTAGGGFEADALDATCLHKELYPNAIGLSNLCKILAKL